MDKEDAQEFFYTLREELLWYIETRNNDKKTIKEIASNINALAREFSMCSNCGCFASERIIANKAIEKKRKNFHRRFCWILRKKPWNKAEALQASRHMHLYARIKNICFACGDCINDFFCL